MNFHSRSLNPFRITTFGVRSLFLTKNFLGSDIFGRSTHTYTHARAQMCTYNSIYIYIMYGIYAPPMVRRSKCARLSEYSIRAEGFGCAALYPSVSSPMFNYVGDDRRN